MKQSTTKPDSLQPATELAVDLFDNWFDPIETEVRARSRQFIEELIRGAGKSAIGGLNVDAGTAAHHPTLFVNAGGPPLGRNGFQTGPNATLAEEKRHRVAVKDLGRLRPRQ